MASGSSQEAAIAPKDEEVVQIGTVTSSTDSQRILRLEKRLQDFSTCFRLLWPLEDEEPEITMPPLHYACKCGDLELVKLLARGIPVETVAEIESEKLFGETSYTPLMLAAKYGNVKIMGFLISLLPANAVKAPSKTGVPLLRFAAYGGLRAFNLIRNRYVGSLRKDQLEDSAKGAASGGQIPLLELIQTELKEVAFSALGTKLANGAATHGRLEVLKWLTSQRVAWKSDISEKAAYRGHVDIIEWLQDTKVDIDEGRVVWWAIYGDSIPVLEYMKSKGFQLDATVIPTVKPTGDYIFDPDCTYEFLNALHIMARYGSLELLRWAKLQNLTMNPLSSHCGPTLGQIAARHGEMEVLNWLEEAELIEEDTRWDVLAAAMTGGHVDIVSEYMESYHIHYRDEKGRNLGHYLAAATDATAFAKILGMLLPLGFRYCYDFNGDSPLHYAAKANNLEALKLMKPSAPAEAWAKTNQEGFTVAACAAKCGSVNMLNWLQTAAVLSVGPPKAYLDAIAACKYDTYRWMKNTAQLVIPQFEWASVGNLDVFQFLARSETITKDALFGAAYYGHNDIIDYCTGPECSLQLIDLLADATVAHYAAKGKKLETLRHLKSRGVNFDEIGDGNAPEDIVTWALKEPPHNIEVLKFLAGEGCDCTAAKVAGIAL